MSLPPSNSKARRNLQYSRWTALTSLAISVAACDTGPFGHGVPPSTGGAGQSASATNENGGMAGSELGAGGESSGAHAGSAGEGVHAGGSPTTGGNASAGGTSNSSVIMSLGGSSGTGGTTGKGGTSTSGGSSGSGGSTGFGGSTSRGGTQSAGGTVGSGGTSISTSSTAPNCSVGSVTTTLPTYQMEELDRGLVAIAVTQGVYLGWRMLGTEYDAAAPERVSYNVYRGGTLLTQVTSSTNFLDPSGTLDSTYAVAAVIDSVEQPVGPVVTVWSANAWTIPIQLPAAGVTDRSSASQTDSAYTYVANDGSPGDLDGDGRLDIVLKWDPSNSRDNSLDGFTGNVLFDGYRLDGTRLWRIDLGRNVRAGAHYTQFLVYDFDGNGRSEVVMRTAPGAKDGTGAYLHLGPAASDDDAADYRNASGYVLTGPEYLTVFDGRTGAELATVNFEAPRGDVAAWGDSYGNRVDRFLASAGFVSDTAGGKSASGRPSILMARGYYTRSTVTAWNFRDGALTRTWAYDSNIAASATAAGQGAHHMVVADVDFDGAQEVVYGAATIDSNGCITCSTTLGHGDALHVTDLAPARAGLEVFMPHESTTGPSYDLRDAGNCSVLQQGPVRGADTGRGVAGDIEPSNFGSEMWASGSTLLSASTGANLGSAPSAINYLVWWDSDESRELLDGTTISKFSAGSLLTCPNCSSNNGTKATPVLVADLLGDWREEVLWRKSDNTALVLYTTTNLTQRRIYTLMHDAQYRMHLTSQQTGYNQPPHPSFHIGSGMAAPPNPRISVR